MLGSICVMAFAAMVGTFAVGAQGVYPPKLRSDRVVTYKKVGDLELKLWVYQPKDWKATDQRPAIVFFFGGGWVGGSPQQFEPQAQHLAELGMVAMVADYRVSSRNKTTPIACVKDGCSAMRYIRKHAKELGIDPHRIAAGGGSAGGHVAAATATVTPFNEDSDDLSVSCVPDALVLFNPVFDNGPKGYGHDRVKDYWRKISPIDNVRKGIPPSVVMLGTKDRLIPVATAERWKAEVEKVGGRAELHFYEGAGHGFFNQTAPIDYRGQTIGNVEAFLASLGWIKPPADVPADKSQSHLDTTSPEYQRYQRDDR